MSLTEQDIRDFYKKFNDNDLDALVECFHSDGVCNQLNGNSTAKGHIEIRRMIGVWKHCFTGARIEGLDIRQVPHLVSEVPGATQCFITTGLVVDVYDNTVPCLEQAAPAMHMKVRLPFGDNIWLDAQGNIRRTDNGIAADTL